MLHSKCLLIRPKLCGFYRLNTSNVHLIVLSQEIHYQTLPSLPAFLQQLPNEVFSNANMPLCLASQCPEWFRGVFSFLPLNYFSKCISCRLLPSPWNSFHPSENPCSLLLTLSHFKTPSLHLNSSPLLFVVVQPPSCVPLFASLWTAACLAFVSLTISVSLPKFMSIESVMPLLLPT